MPTWAIDPGVARDLAALIGWSPDDDAVALTRALAAGVPSGSTAKLAAVAAGETPPGADPEGVARRILGDRAAGRPEPAWACWPMTTLMAALIATLTDRDPAVVGIRRIDATAPAVDIHSLVIVEDLLCDPYFASAVAGPGSDADERVVGGVWCRRVDEPDGRWSLEVGNGRWGRALAYRLLAPRLDRGDVAALCAVSATHSGAPPRALAFVKGPTTDVEAITHSDGRTAVRTWTWDPDQVWDGTVDQVEHATWAEAATAFESLTGIPLA